MRARLALLCVFALGLACGPAGAQQSGAAGAATPPRAVLELFTSQGCASCPPADELLGELAKDPDIIAITLAVDYWDYVGWKDTLAKHGHSVRQRAYAEKRGDRMIYTPQIIVDGVAPAKGSDKAAVLKTVSKVKGIAQTLSVPVALSVRSGELVIDISRSPTELGGAPADIWVCPVVGRQEVAIGRGENAGKTVSYTNVVRGWIRLGPWSGEPATYTVPLDKIRAANEDGVVVMVQSGTHGVPGPILGAARLAFQ